MKRADIIKSLKKINAALKKEGKQAVVLKARQAKPRKRIFGHPLSFFKEKD
jgi:hypothetical protein